MGKRIFRNLAMLLLYFVTFSAMAEQQFLSDGSIQTFVDNGDGASTQITETPDGTVTTVDISVNGRVTTTTQTPDGSVNVTNSTGIFN